MRVAWGLVVLSIASGLLGTLLTVVIVGGLLETTDVVGGAPHAYMTAVGFCCILVLLSEDRWSRTNGCGRPAEWLRALPTSRHSDEEIDAARCELQELGAPADTDVLRRQLVELIAQRAIRTKFRLRGYLGRTEARQFDDLVVRAEDQAQVKAAMVLLEDWYHAVSGTSARLGESSIGGDR